MKNVPGTSWGFDHHVNLIRSSKGWLALYYDNEHSKPEIIRVFKLKNTYDWYQMMRACTLYNYNTCTLCPEVKAAMDWQA
jgi:hypothetical protein